MLVFAAAVCVAGALHADQPPGPDLMQQKLVYSQNILAGLATENFDAIVKNAKRLDELGKQRWVKQETPTYRAQHLVFWFANDELIRLAEEKNIDGAALSYVQMTISCVNCHKVLRQQ
jgi:hypothetical protein